MEDSIQKIEQLISALRELQPLKPEYQDILDKKIRLEFNYNSNHIEGNTLTYGETELLLIFGKTTGNHDLREYEEMKAHNVTFEMVKEWAKEMERPLTETDIKDLNRILLVSPYWKEAITPNGQDTMKEIHIGEYKKMPNSVRLQNGEIFHYASPEETPALMGDLIQWYRNEEVKGEMHPANLAALLHYKFVCIHPFDDGNGRISRLLLNYALLKNKLPPVIIKTSDKKNYLFALNQADTGNENAFIEYVLGQLINSLEMNIRAAKGENLEEDGDLLKEISILSKQVSNGNSITKHPKIIYDIFNWFQKTM
ncbi:MAG TPA: Fic family protein [Saprospiraceae bacterium]|nr:Fic family protein [Saprospiraceae bacterium]